MQILPYKKVRLFISLLSMMAVDIAIYYYLGDVVFKSAILTFMFCIFLSFQFYFSVEFSWGSGEVMEFSLKTKARQALDKEEAQLQLLEGAKNNIIFDVLQGNLSPDIAKERIDFLNDMLNGPQALPSPEFIDKEDLV